MKTVQYIREAVKTFLDHVGVGGADLSFFSPELDLSPVNTERVQSN